MTTRRSFLKWSAMSAALASVTKSYAKEIPMTEGGNKPIVISTWKHGVDANADAWKVLSTRGRALDAVEKGCNEF
jgi:N4-(beta-N-acetylglucosaminyl)-L-asparaginase